MTTQTPDTTIKNIVAEARKMLANGSVQLPLRVEGWHKSLTDGGWFIRNASGRTLMTVEFVPVELETGRPALDGNAPARTTVALLNAVPALCNQVEALRDACRQFVHWYAEDSTEEKRDNAYDAAIAALALVDVPTTEEGKEV